MPHNKKLVDSIVDRLYRQDSPYRSLVYEEIYRRVAEHWTGSLTEFEFRDALHYLEQMKLIDRRNFDYSLTPKGNDYYEEHELADRTQTIEQRRGNKLQILAIIVAILGVTVTTFALMRQDGSNGSTPKPTDILEKNQVTLHLEKEKRLKVVYPLDDGVALRNGPGMAFEEIDTLMMNEVLLVIENPIRGEDRIKWWPVETPYGNGWVAEWVRSTEGYPWRLVKPELIADESAVIVNPTGEGAVNIRDTACAVIGEIEYGIELTIIESDDDKCDGPREFSRSEGREWWYVELPNGARGWVADFGSAHKAQYLAPIWYQEMSLSVPPP